jgi:predicted nucleic acid-binding protein
LKYLIDTNVLLEAALQRARWREASHFLSKTPVVDLAVADFSLLSLGFYLWKTPETFDRIVGDVLAQSMAILRLEPIDLPQVTRLGTLHRLSFDDAVIYAVAELHNLTIVTFDTDFDRTPRGRFVPSAMA